MGNPARAVSAFLLLAAAWEICPEGLTVATLQVPPPSPEATPGVTFEDVTAAAGLDTFRHMAGESPEKPYLPETLGSGVALIDYDSDGWLDIYLVNSLSHAARRGQRPPERAALFRNNRNGTFTDVTSRAGVENGRWGVGVCVGDFDNDGHPDLYVTNFGPSRLYHNNGNGTFSDVAATAGVQVNNWATGCAFGDYNGDGRLDLYVAGYVDFDWNHPPPPGGSGRAPAGSAAPSSGDRPAVGAVYRPDQPTCNFLGAIVACGPLGLKGAPDFLFRNEGNGKFSDVTVRAGVTDAELRYGLAVGWADVDDDGRPDLVVANDSKPNYLYRNKGDGTFEELGLLSGLGVNGHGREQAYMGMASGDYNHDGRADFFFTTFSGDIFTLHRNDGGLNFTDVSLPAGLGVTVPFLGWGAEFFDYDNDGWLDLLAANGHVFPQADPVSWSTSYLQRTLLLRNLNGGRFVDVTGSLGSGWTTPKASRGAAVGDLLNDGDLDVVLNNLDAGPSLLQNRGGRRAGHWITLRLVGDPSRQTPRDATGAVVFCTAGATRQRAEVASGRGYVSQSDSRVHFGLGAVQKIDRLEVRWPNNRRETFALSGVDRIYTIEQGKGIGNP